VKVEHLEVLVEEPSAEAALGLLLPKLLPTTSLAVHPHQGKADLLAKLPGKLRGYASWIPETWRILVLVDRDDDDCDELKALLEEASRDAGLATRTSTKMDPWRVVNRLAIEELEAWYFGDWQAVRNAFPRVAASVPRQSRFRDPDSIAGGTWEAFERVLQQYGYFSSGLRKIEAARMVASHMDPIKNTSESFCVFRDALLELRGP
jgi:hypothetical protein